MAKKISGTENIVKFQTLFFFCSQRKCWLSRLEFTKCLSEKQTRNTLMKSVLGL